MSENKNPSIYKMRRIGDTALEYLSHHCSCESEVVFKCPECSVADEIKELREETARLRKALVSIAMLERENLVINEIVNETLKQGEEQ